MARRTPKLGQHFLAGQWAAAQLAEAVGVHAGETVVEIGPGKGALTRELLHTGAPVIAIEKDEVLVAQLRETFTEEIAAGKLHVLEDDIRNFDPMRSGLTGSYVVAANIPYYITGEIIRMFLEAQAQPRAMALLIQKEVAERILARDGKESILSLSVKTYGTPRIVAKVARGNFSPPPKVDSAILLIDNISKKSFSDMRERDFFTVVRAGFASKRKYLANNLATVFGKHNTLQAMTFCGLTEKVRAEDVPLPKWHALTTRLSDPGRG